MAVRPRGGAFQVDVQVKGRRWRGTAETQADAEILEADIKHRMLAGKPLPVEAGRSGRTPMTLGALVQHVYDHHWRDMASGTQALLNAKNAVLFFGTDQSTSGLTTEKLDEWVAQLERDGKSNATINRKLAALSKCLRFAKQRGWIKELPHFPRKKESKGRVRFFTVEEESAILADLEHHGYDDLRDLVVVLADTGLRLSEALGLDWADISLGERPRLTVWHTKNGEARTVPLTPRLVEVFKGREGSAKPFRMNRWSARDAWDRMRERLGYADDSQYVLHTLRHTCASRLVQRGVPITVVKEWLGHKTITVTMRYAHLSPDQLFDAVKVLGDGAGVAELAYATDLKSVPQGVEGSSPSARTN